MTDLHERVLDAAHDRAALHRGDPSWLEDRWHDPRTKVLVVAGNRIPPFDDGAEGDGDGVPWRRPDQVAQEARDGVRVLLGQRDGVTHFAILLGREHGGEGWFDLRRCLAVFANDPTDASFVMHAVGIAEWHRATPFCARCGRPVSPRAAGHELVCPDQHVTFPRTDPAVIMLIAHGEPGSPEERCLLGNHVRWPEGRYSTLAGFCEPGETLEDAVRREVAEESGVRVGEVHYVGNQPWPLPASLMLGFIGRAESTAIVCDPDEIRTARWFTRAELHDLAESGEIALPSAVSISRALIETWYGGRLPGSW